MQHGSGASHRTDTAFLCQTVLFSTSVSKLATSRQRRAKAAVEAATRELEGAQSGDGRDSSGRSLKERLEDAKQAQVRSLTYKHVSIK